MSQAQVDVRLLAQRLERERRARKEAEYLLEDKSRELFRVNQDMQRAADALSLESSRLSAVLDNVGEGIITFFENGEIEAANRGADCLLGYEPGQLLGRPIVVCSTMMDPTRSKVSPSPRIGMMIAASVSNAPPGVATGPVSQRR